MTCDSANTNKAKLGGMSSGLLLMHLHQNHRKMKVIKKVFTYIKSSLVVIYSSLNRKAVMCLDM